jgi:hypothetical protein
MSIQSELVGALGAALRPLGFRRRSSSWWRLAGDLYSIVNVQSSRLDESCYVNIGFSPADRVSNEWIPESQCLVRFRVEALNSVSVEMAVLLGADACERLGMDSWRLAVSEGVIGASAEAVGRVNNLGDLKEFLRRDVSARVFVHRDMRELLRIAG